MRSLVWFRTDLRAADNTALHHAATQASSGSMGGVLGVFVISPAEWKRHDFATVKVDLILRTLAQFSEALASLNIPLVVLHAKREREIPVLLVDLAREHRCSSLHFNREYEVDEQARDAAVTRAFEDACLEVHAWDDQAAIAPGLVRTGENRFFTVFTPFKRRWITVWQETGGHPPLAAPKRQVAISIKPSPVPASVEGFASKVDPAIWPAGEQHAAKRLRAFARSAIEHYKDRRDFPALDSATSQLSPYLAIGTISPRQCIAAALDANERASNKRALDAGDAGAACWISELIWREFYIHVLAGYPRVCKNRAFQIPTDRIKWSYDERHFRAWCEGKTGVPIVDAAIRQLLATGWMHNRLRMVAAMYLTKDLFIDWRWGERFFMRHLVDGFFASNNGGWQWSASTGTDAAPYFRIFNPYSQSEKFDPDGEFIRKYVPELASLESDAIHDPSRLPPLARAGIDYPDPIVDRAKVKARVLEAFQAIKQQTPTSQQPAEPH